MKLTYTIAFILYCTANVCIITQIYSSNEHFAMQAVFSLLTWMILSILYLSLVDWLNELHYPEPKAKVGTDRRAVRPASTQALTKDTTSHPEATYYQDHQDQLARKYAIKH